MYQLLAKLLSFNKPIRLLLWMVLFCGVMLATTSAKTAYATIGLVPDPGPTALPTSPGNNIRGYFENADSYPKTPAFNAWVSEAFNPGDDQPNVAFNQSSVSLDYNFGGVVGWDVNTPPPSAPNPGGIYTLETRNNLDWIRSPDGTTPAPGGPLVISGFNNSVGAYRQATKNFTLIPWTPFTGDRVYSIEVQFRSISYFSNGAYRCVGGGEQIIDPSNPNYPWDYGTCDFIQITIPIFVDVDDQGTILGRVFIDYNANKIRDAGEPLTQNTAGRDCGTGAADVPVNVMLDGGPQVDVTRCNPEPHYQFDNVNANQWHSVQLANLPAGWEATIDPQTFYVSPGEVIDRWFGMRPIPRGNILGRIYVDENANSVWDPGEETLVQTPPAPCGVVYIVAPVSISATGLGVAGANNCTPPDPYYQFLGVAPGNYTLQLINLPPGWVATTGSRTVTVNAGADTHQWFGMRLPPPVVTTQCNNGVITANISWNQGGLGPTNYVVDLDDNTNWGDGYTYKAVPSGTTTTTALAGFSGSPVFSPSTQYYVRVSYSGYNGVHSGTTPPFTTPGNCWGFNITADASVALLPDDENPTSATFDSSFIITYTPASVPPGGVRLNVTRKYFVIRQTAPLVEVPLAVGPGPPATENRIFNGTSYNYPQESRSLPIPMNPGDKVCLRITVDPKSGQVDAAGNVSSSGPPEVKLHCELVANKPYFRVYNSDVLTGFSNCPGWTTASSAGALVGYNDTTGKGSGVQLAAFAIDTIKEFSSATGRTSPPLPAIIPPKGLSFANKNPAEIFGGSFGGGFCPEDYFAAAAAVTTTTNAASRNVGPLADGSTRKDPAGNLVLNPGGGAAATTILAGQKKVLYVQGDVYIMNKVIYGGAPWASIDQIPSFTLVVKGDIYISKDIDTLDGIYVAQPNLLTGSGGEIHTCGIPSGSILVKPPSPLQIINDCDDKQLTVNGAFIAKRVRLQRSIGSLRNSNNTDTRTQGMPAEKFIFSPEAWLSTGIDPTSNKEPYDSITSVPPVL